MIKLNLGCAGNLMPGYINIDMDSLETIQERYPGITIPKEAKFLQADVLALADSFELGSVDEIRSDSLVEHIGFKDEAKFFEGCRDVLKIGGALKLSTPDFEWVVNRWLKSEDNWKDFFRNDSKAIEEEHWFGQYSYRMDQRWGYLTASMFGSQNGEGQFHHNAYTEKKLLAIMRYLNFHDVEIHRSRWKESREIMLHMTAFKFPLERRVNDRIK